VSKHWFILGAAALIATGTAHAGGNPIQADPIRAKVDAPVFLGPTPECAEFRAHTRLLSEAGAVIGSSMFCVSSAPVDEIARTRTESGTLVLHLAGGEIAARATIVDYFGVYPIVQTISGTITSGNGLYRGATGTLSGGGTIVFDEDGTPHPDSTLIVDFA
jgi:hypothetical protein